MQRYAVSIAGGCRTAFSLLLTFWVFSSVSLGLHPLTPLSQYGHDVWDSDSGLPQNSVDAIAQTRDGYLWLGTQEGLVRFDGVRFTVFDTRNTAALHDDWVHALRQTRDGTLWVGTAEGLVPLRDGKFPTRPSEGELSHANVLALFESRDGSVWAGLSRGIARRHGEDVRIFGEKDGVPAGAVLAIAEDRDGVLWAGSRAGLFHLDGERFVPAAAAAPPAAVLSLSSDPEGGLWVGTTRGLAHWDGRAFTSEALPNGAAGAPVQALYRDDEGTLWIGTAHGLARRAGGIVSFLSREHGLSSDEVLYAGRTFFTLVSIPDWVSGVFDGKIRIAVDSAAPLTSSLKSVLAHELTHAAIRELSRDRAPGWLHEGLAQWCEGRRALRQDLREAFAHHAVRALRELEASFARADLEGVRASYAEALGLVEFLLQQRGSGAVSCVLADLAAGATIDSALSLETGWDSSTLLEAWVRWAGLKASSAAAPR